MLRIEHNRVFRNLAPVAALRSAWWVKRSALLRALRVRGRVGYVWRPCASAAAPAKARAAQQPVGALAAAPPTRVFSQAARRKGGVDAPHARRGLLRAPAALRASVRVLAALATHPPRKRGSPNFNGNPATVGRKLPPFAQGG